MIDLSVATLVDQLADGLEVGFTISNPRLDDAKHLRSCLGKLDEHTIVDLEEAEKLKDFAGLRGDLVYTDPSSVPVSAVLGVRHKSGPLRLL